MISDSGHDTPKIAKLVCRVREVDLVVVEGEGVKYLGDVDVIL